MLSPILFQKNAVPGGKAVGRVQSPALRLLVEREYERRYFRSGEFWDISSSFRLENLLVEGGLYRVDGRRIASSSDFDADTGQLKKGASVTLVDKAIAGSLVDELTTATLSISSVQSREEERKPKEPFRTVSLQQAAASGLGWTTDRTMKVAQRLYEEGHITYMRTDSVSLSAEATAAARAVVTAVSPEFLPPGPVIYATTSTSAQEAHEAIRPAGTEWVPAAEKELSDQEAKLYDLIYRRTVASQMLPARLQHITVDIECGRGLYRVRAQRTIFQGYRAVYSPVDSDEQAEHSDSDASSILEKVAVGQSVGFVSSELKKHETRPPARFTETRLIGRLEEEGVGRPSTYSSTIKALIRHGHVRRDGRTLIPTFVGLGVVKFLGAQLDRYIDLQYTAAMEDHLDEIAVGKTDSQSFLSELHAHLAERSEVISGDIGAVRVVELAFDDLDDSIHVMLGKYGVYLVSENHEKNRNVPETVAPADLSTKLAIELLNAANGKPFQVERANEGGGEIWVKYGQHGSYLELVDEKGKKQTASIPMHIAPSDVDRVVAERLLRPIAVDGLVEIYLRSGKGWYLQWEDGDERRYRNVPKSFDPMNLTEEQVLFLYRMPHELGPHPETGGLVTLDWGRHGPYVRLAREGQKDIIASVDQEDDWTEMMLSDAVELLQDPLAKASQKVMAKAS